MVRGGGSGTAGTKLDGTPTTATGSSVRAVVHDEPAAAALGSAAIVVQLIVASDCTGGVLLPAGGGD